MKREINTDLLVSIVTGVLGAVIVYASTKLPFEEASSGGGPRTYPLILGVSLVFLSSLLAWKSRRIKKKEEGDESRSSVNFLLMVFVVAFLILYPFLLKLLGFLMSTSIFLAVCMLRLRREKLTAPTIGLICLLSGAITGVIFFLFRIAVKVPLPIGLLFGD